MESIFGIALILLAKFIGIYSRGNFIVFEDPTGTSILEKYLERTVQGGDGNTNPNFAMMDNGFKKHLCLRSINNVHFISRSIANLQPIDLTDSIETRNLDVNRYYDELSPEQSRTVSVKIHLANRITKSLQGIPCTNIKQNHMSSIVDGSDSNHYYIILVEKVNQSSYYGKFSALVQELPTVVDDDSTSNTKILEKGLTTSQLRFMTHPDFKSMHSLDNFNRLKACSSVYMALEWDDEINNDKLQYSVRNPPNVYYVPETLDLLDQSLNSDFTEMHVIACAINTDISTPQFYLAVDYRMKTSGAAAFVLTDNENTKKGIVTARVMNVLGLETLYA